MKEMLMIDAAGGPGEENYGGTCYVEIPWCQHCIVHCCNNGETTHTWPHVENSQMETEKVN